MSATISLDCSRQAPLSMGILQSRMLEWVAMPSFQGIFPTQGSNLGLLHYRLILYHLSHQGSPLTLIKAYKSKQALLLLFLHLSTYFFPRHSTELSISLCSSFSSITRHTATIVHLGDQLPAPGPPGQGASKGTCLLFSR